MDDKVIVTNLSALKSKYGAGVSKIQAAIKKLVTADKKRGIQTRLVALDDAKTMKSLGAPVVTNATDPQQNKAAIDGVYAKLLPDFLMILGSIDVVPHQNLINPVQDGDGEPFAFGDLPYACEAPYSQRPEDFRGPTRVVGRLPDLTGGGDPAYLVGLLKTATTAKPESADKYASYFGITAEVWQESTRESLEKLFGSGADLKLSPEDGPEWDKTLISRRSHFINCHGAETNSHFFGQRGNDYPTSHDASYIAGKIEEGTVAAVECCYGGQLYNPGEEDEGRHSICNTYLEHKAYGFFGSTTIAYGPPAGNGSADLICQFFLKRVLAGASIGRAALEARHEFIEASPEMDPFDVKTLAQFNLYGDPSIIPVAVKTPSVSLGTTRAAKSLASPKGLQDAATVERTERRRQLLSKGLWLAKNHPVAKARKVTLSTSRGGATAKTAKSLATGGTSSAVESRLRELAGSIKMDRTSILSFDIERPPMPRAVAKAFTAGAPPAPTAFHVIMGSSATPTPPAPVAKSAKRGAKSLAAPQGGASGVKNIVALVAKEVGGKIVSVREVHGK